MNRKSFTLVETMIILAIISLLAAIVIPGLLKTKISANEQEAVSVARAIYISARNFSSANSGQYPQSLDAFENAQVMTATSEKKGYRFHYLPVGSSPAAFWVSIEPVSSTTGTNFYYVDEQGIVCKGTGPAREHVSSRVMCPENFYPVK